MSVRATAIFRDCPGLKGLDQRGAGTGKRGHTPRTKRPLSLIVIVPPDSDLDVCSVAPAPISNDYWTASP